MTSKCVEEHSAWSFYNQSKMEYTEDLSVNCSTIKDVCCDKVRINSSSPITETGNSTYGNVSSSFGVYTAIGTRNGRYIYQMEGETDIFLEFGNSFWGTQSFWLVTTGIGQTRGKIRYDGGSICPEHVSGGWMIPNGTRYSGYSFSSSWKEEPGITVTCEGKEQVRDPSHLFEHCTWNVGDGS